MRDEARGEYLKPSVRERKAEFSRKQVSCLKKIPPYTGDGFLVGRKMVKSSFLSTDSYNCTRLADHLSKFEILTSKSNNRSIIPRIIGDDFSIEAESLLHRPEGHNSAPVFVSRVHRSNINRF